MKKLSLSLKISSSFIVISITTLGLLYFAFYYLFEQHMLKVEEEKAILIAQTIEPLISMSYFLSLDEDIKQLATKMAEHKQIAELSVIIDDQLYWSKESTDKSEYIRIAYPITSPLSLENVGHIKVAYTKDALNKALQQIHTEIIYYLGALAFVFIIYIMFTRYLLSPFGQIAQKVQDYEPGSTIDFSSIRVEPEVNAIITAFESMVSNIREYTVLLERYKHSIDESASVVRMDLQGIITYTNDEFCRLSGYSRNESLGQSIFVICRSDTNIEQNKEILETVQARKVWKGTLQNTHKNGKAYYVKSTMVPILDDKENIIELISIQQDITQVIEQKAQIVRQTTDPTTGLYNRVKLEENIPHVNEPKFAIISLDNYNVIKDYYGLESSKKILKEVASIFLSITSIENISVYKLSGCDYAVLGNQAFDMDLFHGICRTLLEKINNYTIQLEDGTLNIGASAGLTSDKDHLLVYAGLALQHAQDTRHLTIIYEETENLVQRFENNITWTKKLNLALNEDRIVLFVQPIFNSKTLKIEKYECLVRMIDEDGETVISPYAFLEIAKQSKLYHRLTEQVISSCFNVFSRVPDVDFSINFSLEDLLHVPTIEFLKSMLEDSGLASRFVLEIVESEGIENFEEVSSFVSDMKKRGCRIAIDDFGSGYSNFAYLMELDIDYIKIDGSLIKSIDKDANSQIITSTILDFSHQLGIATIAEFVHNQAILDYVQNMGIDYVQGFHLGEPVAIENLIS
ncbi:MAG: EAL domain-containing protein [Gammaproteobacteria bacterium]|nr:EAL domain-containing protein [Gammaproteobacteria bacterium]MCW8910248.1 EAL domain-containing protein [Gammaproteobacteria bacterium]